MAVSAAKFPGLTQPVSAEDYVFRLLMNRAEQKLTPGVGSDYAMQQAVKELRKAGRWTDDVQIQIGLKKPLRSKGYVRMLHGVPSPRLFPAKAPNWPMMVAKDAIYFFAHDLSRRQTLMLEAMPHLPSVDDLRHWLEHFSTTRFEKQLIEALVKEGDAKGYGKAAMEAAEIDRMAWFTGQKSMTLANAAPVWKAKV
ncbi:hypothetical protein HNP46_006116 [Pseudomonas nitritireducens]|uniref:Uncharacterized protein n=1 Tax=Pseudomonas nitroreducens TaxID=46680 RepID=A0A7W7KQN2_PSENT|nr:hypothetical protein [Pseudomonas nitritireducens]MBB4867205.1 hypothetical protein [Pseudomonas nitritireducens]